MVAHPVPVAIPTTPAAGPPFPSFVTGAPTAYVIPTAAMLQPMIPGPAFYSLTSLPALHASGMPPVSMISFQSDQLVLFFAIDLLQPENKRWHQSCHIVSLLLLTVVYLIVYDWCSTFTITPITCIGLPTWPVCPFLGLIITRKTKRRVKAIWTIINDVIAARLALLMTTSTTSQKGNWTVRNWCRSGVSRTSRRRLNNSHQTSSCRHSSNNNQTARAWSAAISTREWIVTLLKNSSFTRWQSSKPAAAASRVATLNAMDIKFKKN